jgi:hypothetical protein
MSNIGMAALFSVLTAAFAGITVAGASAGRWVIAVSAAAITFWLGSFALGALRRIRR